jgi:hypothetical protein
MSQTSNGQPLPNYLTKKWQIGDTTAMTQQAILDRNDQLRASEANSNALTLQESPIAKRLIPNPTESPILPSNQLQSPTGNPNAVVLGQNITPTSPEQQSQTNIQPLQTALNQFTPEGNLEPTGRGMTEEDNANFQKANSYLQGTGSGVNGKLPRESDPGMRAAGNLGNLLDNLKSYYAGRGMKNMAMNQINKLQQNKMMEEYRQGQIDTKDERNKATLWEKH